MFPPIIKGKVYRLSAEGEAPNSQFPLPPSKMRFTAPQYYPSTDSDGRFPVDMDYTGTTGRLVTLRWYRWRFVPAHDLPPMPGKFKEWSQSCSK